MAFGFSFSPLVIGAIGATAGLFGLGHGRSLPFSPLVIGAIGATIIAQVDRLKQHTFSPLVIGAIGATPGEHPVRGGSEPFSPLVIGAIGATLKYKASEHGRKKLSVPL